MKKTTARTLFTIPVLTLSLVLLMSVIACKAHSATTKLVPGVQIAWVATGGHYNNNYQRHGRYNYRPYTYCHGANCGRYKPAYIAPRCVKHCYGGYHHRTCTTRCR